MTPQNGIAKNHPLRSGSACQELPVIATGRDGFPVPNICGFVPPSAFAFGLCDEELLMIERAPVLSYEPSNITHVDPTRGSILYKLILTSQLQTFKINMQ
eukprot:scaffold735_cov116-Cylindrotheca_fusiformis.AAC.15